MFGGCKLYSYLCRTIKKQNAIFDILTIQTTARGQGRKPLTRGGEDKELTEGNRTGRPSVVEFAAC